MSHHRDDLRVGGEAGRHCLGVAWSAAIVLDDELDTKAPDSAGCVEIADGDVGCIGNVGSRLGGNVG
jgi:hypothetical protein